MDNRSSEQLTDSNNIREHIRSLTNPKRKNAEPGSDEKSVLYYIYKPAYEKITIPKYIRNAHFTIAYLKPALLARCLVQLLDEVVKEKVERSDAVALIRHLKDLKTPLVNWQDGGTLARINNFYQTIPGKGFLSGDSQLLIQAMTYLVKVIEGKKASPECLTLLEEMNVWLAGLRLHLSIQYRRIELIEAIADESRSKLVNFPIPKKEHEQVSLGTSQCLINISKMNTEESQPVILSILQDIIAKTVNIPARIKTYQSICCVYNKVLEATEMDFDFGIGEKLSYLTKNKKTIIPGLQELLEALRSVQVYDDITHEVGELQIWLKGFYFHYYNESNEISAPLVEHQVSSATDGLIKNRLSLGEYYYQGGVVLAEKLKNRLPDHSFKEALAGEEDTIEIATKKIDGDSYEVKLKVPRDKLREVEMLLSVLNAKYTKEMVSLNTFLRRLSKYQDKTADEQVDGMRYILNSTAIPFELQASISEEIMLKAKTCYAEYVNKIKSWKETATYYFGGGLKHKTVADDLPSILQNKDLSTQIVELYKIHDQLVVATSKKLLPVIKEILQHVYTCMINAPQSVVEEDAKPEKRSSGNMSAPALLFSREQINTTNDVQDSKKEKKSKRG